MLLHDIQVFCMYYYRELCYKIVIVLVFLQLQLAIFMFYLSLSSQNGLLNTAEEKEKGQQKKVCPSCMSLQAFVYLCFQSETCVVRV